MKDDELIAMEGMLIRARGSAPRGANRANSPARAGARHLSAELVLQAQGLRP